MAQPKQLSQPKQRVPEPPPPPVAAPAAVRPPATGEGQELSDDDLEYVVGGVSVEAQQFLQSGLGPLKDE